MLEIRTLSKEDNLAAVGEMYARSWQKHYEGILPRSFLERLTGDRWSAMLNADPAAAMAAYEDGCIAGAAITGFARDEGRENYGEIIAIYLHPEAKGRGIGRKLREAAMERLRGEGCESVCLWVMEPNLSAISFYEHMGFRASGRSQQELYAGHAIPLKEYIRKL